MRVRPYPLCVCLLLAVHAGLLAYSGAVHSPTPDEVGHLPSGISHWLFGRFDLYRVNPPLVRSIAALPVLAAGPKLDWSSWREGAEVRSEWTVGGDFLRANGERGFRLFSCARWALIPFGLLGGFVAWRWAGELYGRASGLAALVLWCFCPYLLAWGSTITPDAAAASLGLAAGYAFWRWLTAPRWNAALLAGFALGMAELTKTTWSVLFPLWPMLWLTCRWRHAAGLVPANTDCKRPATGPMVGELRTADTAVAPGESPRQALQLAAILALGLLAINVGYGFDGSFQPLGEYRFVSRALAGERSEGLARHEGGNRFAATRLAGIPIPLPRDYLLGIDLQKMDFERGKSSYLRGEWRHGGWWHYYLVALLLKTPLGTLALFALAVGVRLAGRGYGANWRDELVLLAPAAVVLVLVSSQTGFSRYVRYVVPALPFLYVWIAGVASSWERGHRKAIAAVCGALTAGAVGSLSVYPHSMSYFNVLAGGPERGHAHLVDANIDWGQDLLFLRDWLADHPEARPLHLAHFGLVEPRLAGIDYLPVPRVASPTDALSPRGRAPAGPMPGWHAVSVNYLRGFVHHSDASLPPQGDTGYAYFWRWRPVARAGYSIYIYRVTPEQAAAARRDLGLPPLDD